jgi:hypothetical protein
MFPCVVTGDLTTGAVQIARQHAVVIPDGEIGEVVTANTGDVYTISDISVLKQYMGIEDDITTSFAREGLDYTKCAVCYDGEFMDVFSLAKNDGQYILNNPYGSFVTYTDLPEDYGILNSVTIRLIDYTSNPIGYDSLEKVDLETLKASGRDEYRNLNTYAYVSLYQDGTIMEIAEQYIE